MYSTVTRDLGLTIASCIFVNQCDNHFVDLREQRWRSLRASSWAKVAITSWIFASQGDDHFVDFKIQEVIVTLARDDGDDMGFMDS